MKNTITKGPPLSEATAAIILLHGRGARAEDIVSIYDQIGCSTITAFAPQAPGNTWYPYSFMAPLDQNQPFLDQSLKHVDDLVQQVTQAGMPLKRVALLGFSQGACLTLEYVIRNPRRYGAVFALTGGFIGPPGTVRTETGSLTGTPVFIGANDPDPHVPFSRVEETVAQLQKMQADVECRCYPGLPHAVNDDEINVCRNWLERMGGNQ